MGRFVTGCLKEVGAYSTLEIFPGATGCRWFWALIQNFTAVVVFPLNHILEVSVTLLASKMTEYYDKPCLHFEWNMALVI